MSKTTRCLLSNSGTRSAAAGGNGRGIAIVIQLLLSAEQILEPAEPEKATSDALLAAEFEFWGWVTEASALEDFLLAFNYIAQR